MKVHTMFALSVALMASPLAMQAQASTTTPSGARREQAAERRDAMRQRRDARQAMTPEQRAEARARREARISSLPAERQEQLRMRRQYQQGLRERARELQSQVTAGTLTRDEMARQLKAYRDANRPTRPAGSPE
jgi:hypothetical protein